MEQNKVKKIIRNIATILTLDLILFPLAVVLYLFHGFHIIHVVVGVGYLYGLILVFDVAKFMSEHVRIVNNEVQEEKEFIEEEPGDFCCEGSFDSSGCTCYEEGEHKPEMKQAMDEVFGLKK